jgi:hypothetical protein
VCVNEREGQERERERELEVTLWIVMEIVDKRKRE